ncbi:MAG TPA: DUF6799 domain-containing protein [Anaerolineales bacterium]|nr:DUF6799 domain-containing protein [Anaerolineales bacterium]
MVIEQGLLIMTHEQVILLKNGELVILTEDLTLPDGTRVALDGSVTMANGTL